MPKDKTTELLNTEPFEVKEFLIYEKDRAKAVVLVFLMAILLAAASAYLYLQGMWYFAVLFFLALVLFLRHILVTFKIPFPKRGWHKFLLYAQLFFTWLIFWIVFLNPPFAVVSGPQIGTPQYELSGGAWQDAGTGSGAYLIPYNASLHIRVPVSFVSGITSYSVTEMFKSTGYPNSTLAPHLYAGYLYFNITNSPIIGEPVYLTVSVASGSLSTTDTLELQLSSS